MVKRGQSSTAAVCSIIRSHPRRIRRSASRTSLDVKGSYVMKKVWMFEGLDEFCNTDDQLSDRDTAKDELCLSHSWFLFTNIACSQHCANCRKRIHPHRAAYKCTACKQICHLKCAIKPEDMPVPDRPVETVNSEMNEFGLQTNSSNVQKQHFQTRNKARLRKQKQKEEEVEDVEDGEESFNNFKQNADLNASIQSQAKLKFSSMKHNIVKRCKSIKKKVQKKKKEPEDQVDNNNNNDDLATEERIQAERQAWVTSPVRTRLKARKSQVENSENCPNDNSFDEPRNSVTERRRRVYSTQKKRPKVRAFLNDYELTITHIRDRLDTVEEKIKQLQTTIPTEMGKWKTLQNKYREGYPSSQFDSIPVDSIGSEIHINHETKLKQLEAEANLQSGSSGTTSDEIFLVKDKGSISSQEYMETPGERRNIQPCDEDFIFPEDMSLPSAIPVTFRSGEKTGTGGDHQTSTPVTDHGLGYFKKSQRKDGTHLIRHTNITNIKLNTSPEESKTYAQDIDMDIDQKDVCKLKQTVLSPEQQGVKHFLRQRSPADFRLSPSKHDQSSDRSRLYNSPPMASSTFCQGDDSILASETSPFSFTFRHDLIDRSQASFAKVLDESKLDEGLHQNTSHRQNSSSNLSFTFRNDSQMMPTNDDEDLPGFTRNHSFLTQRQEPVSSNESAIEDEVDMVEASVQCTEALIHERPESSMLTDRTSLTNVTRPTGDFVNSFDDKSNKSRWVNKDVLMFSDSAARQFEHFKRSGSPTKVDERGDSNDKPPIARQNKTERNFLTEAQNKLKSFHIRRNSRENLSVGVCLEKQSYLSDGATSDDECIVEENFVKETVTLREQQFIQNDMDKKLIDMEHRRQSRENTLQEFEKMEKLCQEEAMEQKSLSKRNQTSLSKLESQIIVDTERTTETSISRTSSLESKCSAKYHFLHDKGMIKIESPSLKLVASSPEKRRKHCMQSKLFEEESTDMVESGSVSDLEGVSIDDDFHLNRLQRLISADVESEVAWTKTDDITSETDETDSRIKTEQQMLVDYLKTGTDRHGNLYNAEGEELDEIEAEAELRFMNRQVHCLQDLEGEQAQRTEKQMLEDYLKTVDEGQETWENVMKWMHKECDDVEEEELEAELKSMIKQGDSLDYQEGLPTSDINQDDTIYYSFQAQAENNRPLITQECEETSLFGGCQTYQQNGVKEINYISDDETDSSLMFTIMNGTVEDVKRLLHSDRTISESEIKDGLIWALTNKHLPITILLLEDISKLIHAAEEESIVEVFPAYSQKDPWDPLFVVLSKSDPVKVWDMFMGLPVYRRRCNLVSSETYLVENDSIVKSNPLSLVDSQFIEGVIKSAELHKHHSMITGFNCSAFRSKKEGKEIVKQNCIVIYCLLKGFVPFGENPFPEEIDGIATDIREAYYNLDSITEHLKTSPTKLNLLDNDELVQSGSSKEIQGHYFHQNFESSLSNQKILDNDKQFGINVQNGLKNGQIQTFDNRGMIEYAVKGTMEVYDRSVTNEGVTCKDVTNQSKESVDTVLYKVTLADGENVTNKANKDDMMQHCGNSPAAVLDEDVHMEEYKVGDTK